MTNTRTITFGLAAVLFMSAFNAHAAPEESAAEAAFYAAGKAYFGCVTKVGNAVLNKNGGDLMDAIEQAEAACTKERDTVAKLIQDSPAWPNGGETLCDRYGQVTFFKGLGHGWLRRAEQLKKGIK